MKNAKGKLFFNGVEITEVTRIITPERKKEINIQIDEVIKKRCESPEGFDFETSEWNARRFKSPTTLR